MRIKSVIIPLLMILPLLGGCEDKPQAEPEPSTHEPWGEPGMKGKDHVYITNGKVQLGIDLSRGGAIFHFSTAEEKINRLNHADEGRFIQQSYYGNDGKAYLWSTNNWTWNPIQGGGSDGQPARVDEVKQGPNYIKVVTTPRQWGRLASTGSCPLAEDCRMTETLSLDGNYATLSFKFEYNGDKILGKSSQEMPALFCDWDLNNFVLYNGKSPWTGGELTYITPIVLSGVANQNPMATSAEEWYAYVNDEGYGIGLYTPGTGSAVYYTAGGGPGGAKSGSCSYFAPVRQIHILPETIISYKAYLTIGTVDEIRSTFKAIHEKL
ncbi:MAG: hypothetical protein MJY56_06960 [Bacteroidales bacterium]|nr:hypothetical protein [Bacteroidales bacterium]